ncbi:MAG: (2E,6E)-farnesyl diphosphate synthase [Gammaproteobacteria bacterium]|nr:(2E,6E)-farnesyl diphosphate synthase [Gammaproteobacteria bacterium]
MTTDTAADAATDGARDGTTDSASAFAARLSSLRARANAALDVCLPAGDAPPAHLHQAMRYAVLGGGKRVRATLVYAAGEALGAPDESLDAPASAVELIHAYSLVHDDLPAMDDDDLRRGRPTCHRAFDEATALLAGDALQSLAFEVLAEAPAVSAARRVAMVRALANASGSSGMAGGQAVDLAAVGRKLTLGELENMHVLKTGALIRASVRLGALCRPDAGEAVLSKLDEYARCIGLAFQIRDDILDVEGDTQTLGKTSGADAARNKPTYPAIVGIAEAARMSEALHEQAMAQLEELGAGAALLRGVSEYIVKRAS